MGNDPEDDNLTKRVPPLSPAACFEPLEPRTLLAAVPWGDFPDLINQDGAATKYKNITGKGQTVAVIDTGVDYRHPALGGGWGKTVIAGYDFVDNDKDPMDESGHGTGVASVIAARRFRWGGLVHQGIALGAKIVALRVADSTDFLPEERIERALHWVIKNRTRYHITAINMSLGDGNYVKETSLAPYGDELRRLALAGVFISAASGNEGVRSPAGINYPAADPKVFAVGAINRSDDIASFTSRGPALDLLAPGDQLPLAYYNASTDQHIYLNATGTSFAAPHAAAASMLIRQVNPRLSLGQIMSILRTSGVRNFDGDRESGGTGLTFPRIDVQAAVAQAYRSRTAAAPKVPRDTKSATRLLSLYPPATAGNATLSALFNTEREIGFDEAPSPLA
jgi:subtilisin family serine protease